MWTGRDQATDRSDAGPGGRGSSPLCLQAGAAVERDTMRRNRHFYLVSLCGVLTLAAGVTSSARADELAPSTLLPNGWKEVNLTDGSGNLSLSGSATDPKTVWTMNVNGDDIQGTNDRGYFVYTTLPRDGGITARILSQ